jgi:hypothetical protein
MGNVEMPLGPICNMNIAVRPVSISNLVDLHTRRKHVNNNSIVKSHDAGAQLFAPDKLSVRRIHGEEITFHSDEVAFVTFDGSNKMTLRVALEKLSMNDVNVFPSINDHKQLVSVLRIRALVQVPGLKGNQFKRLATLADKQGKIDTNLAR